jgi:hypothetical protein
VINHGFMAYATPRTQTDNRIPFGKPDPALAVWLTAIGPTSISIPWTVEELVLYGADEIVNIQSQYFPASNGAFPLIIIGNFIGDPIGVSILEPGLPVFFARHGMGPWTWKPLSPNIEKFSEILSVWLKKLICDFKGIILNDDSCITPDAQKILNDVVISILDEPFRKTFIQIAGD